MTIEDFKQNWKKKNINKKMLMIPNEEMTKAQDFFALAPTNKAMIKTSNKRTNIFVEWKISDQTEVKSIFKIILTTFEKNSIEKWIFVA